jgi:hypothetical protein
MAFALVSFPILFKVNVKVGKVWLVTMGLAAALGYVASDFADYYFYTFEKEGQTYRLKDVATFDQYMDIRLSKTEVTHHGSTPMFEVGDTGTKIFYLIDLIGAFLGAAGILWVFRERYPYCARCSRYLKLTYKKNVMIKDETPFKTAFDGIVGAMNESNGDKVRNLLETAAHDKKGLYAIFFESRGCPTCAKGHALLRPSVKKKNNWVEIKNWTVRKDLESPLIRTAPH